MYVGMTRARKRLTLSYASRRVLFGQDQTRTPSRFLAELPPAIAIGPSPLQPTLGGTPEVKERAEDLPSPAKGAAGNLYQQVAQFLERQGRSDAAHQIRDRYGESGGSGSSFPAKKRPAKKTPAGKKPVQKAAAPDKGLRPGSRVRHAKYGYGTILSREGTGDNIKYTIRFQTGARKKMVAKYAKLQVV